MSCPATTATFAHVDLPGSNLRAWATLTYGDFEIRGFAIVALPDGTCDVRFPSKVDPGGRIMTTATIRDAGRRKAFRCYLLRQYRDDCCRSAATDNAHAQEAHSAISDA